MNKKESIEFYDQEIYKLINEEEQRQKNTLQLIAAENIVRKEVLFPLSSCFVSKTAEGIIGNRYHAGCDVVDKLEELAQDRAKELLKSKEVWLQPQSGTLANVIVLTALLKLSGKNRDDFKVLSMGLDHGGHLSHGSKFHISNLIAPNVRNYYVDKETGLLDYNNILAEAKIFKPDVIICGASAYPREINFAEMGKIANEVNAFLISDIAHIFGLVVTENHISPVPYSHFVTCSTYKAGGPKGGMIIAGDLSTEKQCKKITHTLFPGVQSTPDFSSIASKAVFIKECSGIEYRNAQKQIILNSQHLAKKFMDMNVKVATNGTDNHIVLIDVKKSFGIFGKEANKRLEMCNINVNKNLLPYDEENASVTSGIRIGTNTVTRLGMGISEMSIIADLIVSVLISDFNEKLVIDVRKRVDNLLENFSFDKFL